MRSIPVHSSIANSGGGASCNGRGFRRGSLQSVTTILEVFSRLLNSAGDLTTTVFDIFSVNKV